MLLNLLGTLLLAFSVQGKLTLPPLRRALSFRGTADGPCPDTPLPRPLPASALSAALANVSALLDASLNPVSVPGGALVVSYGGEVVLRHYSGVADRSTGRRVDAGTLFRIASVSKVFPAYLLHLLVDAGYLGLDDPLSTQIPFSIENDYDDSVVTFKHLAWHGSGLPREAPFGLNSTADVLAALARTHLILPPGTLPSYSNLGFALLAHALAEGVVPTPTTYENLTEAAILGPLGLASTGFAYTPQVLSALAVGYSPTGGAEPFADLGWWFPAGSMYSTPEDLTRLAVALLQQEGAPHPGRSPARLRDFLSPVFWNKDSQSLMGMPWECRGNQAHLQLTKGGNLPGYTSSMALVPSLNLSVAVHWNGGVDEVAFMDSVLDVVIPALTAALQAAAPSPPFSPGPSPSDYEGTFVLGDSTVKVLPYQGMLVFQEAPELQVSFYLDWLKSDPDAGDLFRVAFPDSDFSCLLGEMEALRYQLVIFHRDCDSGAVDSVSVPGWIPGAVWTRQQ